MTTLVFPVDSESLRLLRESLDACYEVNEDGTRHLVGAEFSRRQLYDFWAGHDPTDVTELGPDLVECHSPTFTDHCALRALIDEVLRLRSNIKGDPS